MQREHHLHPGDFPDVNRYREILSAFDLSRFPKLDKAMLRQVGWLLGWGTGAGWRGTQRSEWWGHRHATLLGCRPPARAADYRQVKSPAALRVPSRPCHAPRWTTPCLWTSLR